MKRLFLTFVMLLMGMALVGGAAVSLVGTALVPLDQQVGTHASAAGAVLGIGLMAAAINPAGNIGWVRAGILYGIVVFGFELWIALPARSAVQHRTRGVRPRQRPAADCSLPRAQSPRAANHERPDDGAQDAYHPSAHNAGADPDQLALRNQRLDLFHHPALEQERHAVDHPGQRGSREDRQRGVHR